MEDRKILILGGGNVFKCNCAASRVSSVTGEAAVLPYPLPPTLVDAQNAKGIVIQYATQRLK